MTQLVLSQPQGWPARALASLLSQPIGTLTVTDPVLRPAALSESRPDGLLAADEGPRPTRVIVEVQLRPDDEKERSWPWYLALTERTTGLFAVLLIAALDPPTADWARALVAADPRLTTRAVVIGPDDVPRFDTLPPEQRTIDTALWSSAMHLRGPRDTPLLAALLDPALPWGSDRDSWNHYVEALTRLAPAVASQDERSTPMTQAATEMNGGEDWVAIFRRTYGDIGRQEARQEGREEAALSSGKYHLNKLLRVRGLSLTPDLTEQVEACQDVALLDFWHDRLLAGDSVEQCFAVRALGQR